MRALAVGALREDMCDIIRDDLCSDTGIERPKTREDLEHVMLDRDKTWGCHSFLVLWLAAISRILCRSVGAVIVSDDHSHPLIVTANEDDELPELAVCLKYITDVHFRLLAEGVSARSPSMIFWPRTRTWTRGPLLSTLRETRLSLWQY
jgi:hypothetical protein